ncbi:MAG: DUF998 domain-containing protein [Sphingobacteriaceae bacterium]|nr:DUF998 domain-containing protein [Sphingobacteriaceae bacterium]
MKNSKASAFGILGVVLFIIATILGGLQIPGYSHTSQLISESYAIGTPYGVLLRFFLFIPSGIFIFLFGIFAIKQVGNSSLGVLGLLCVSLFYGLGTVVVSLFPCDEGCGKELIDPSISQVIHNLTGLLTYLTVPLSLILIGVDSKKWIRGKNISISSFICGSISIIFVGVLSGDLHSNHAGLYQRIVEGSILTWIILCSVYFIRQQRSIKI